MQVTFNHKQKQAPQPSHTTQLPPAQKAPPPQLLPHTEPEWAVMQLAFNQEQKRVCGRLQNEIAELKEELKQVKEELNTAVQMNTNLSEELQQMKEKIQGTSRLQDHTAELNMAAQSLSDDLKQMQEKIQDNGDGGEQIHSVNEQVREQQEQSGEESGDAEEQRGGSRGGSGEQSEGSWEHPIVLEPRVFTTSELCQLRTGQ